MHGVKRLFAWMIPRFDPARYNVSLVSLRKKDLSEETLDALGIDITYLHKSRFDPATLPALLKIIGRKRIDILHLHGYGATTFGRCAGMMRGLPTILHEHANLTDTPWFQSFLAFDPAKVMPDIDQPVLIVQGDLDAQLPPSNADRLEELPMTLRATLRTVSGDPPCPTPVIPASVSTRTTMLLCGKACGPLRS